MTNISLLQLPIDILVNIFKRLQLSDIYNIILTCKTIKELVLSENTIWRHLFKDKLTLHSNRTRYIFLINFVLIRLQNIFTNTMFR